MPPFRYNISKIDNCWLGAWIFAVSTGRRDLAYKDSGNFSYILG